MNASTVAPPTSFAYSPWRHGGWYVNNVRHPSGAVGCVSRNYPDGKWRIVCDPRDFEDQPTFKNRDAAARAEFEIAQKAHELVAAGKASPDEAFKMAGRA